MSLSKEGVAMSFHRCAEFVGYARKAKQPADRVWNLFRNDAVGFLH